MMHGLKNHGELRSHGKDQIEIKTRYPLRKAARTRYEMDLYVITPHQLGLVYPRYGIEEFYRDVTTHTRYTIQEIPLTELASFNYERSPAARIKEIISYGKELSDSEVQELVFELRSLSNYYSTQVKYFFRLWKREYSQEKASYEALERHMDEITECIRVFRDLLSPLFHEAEFQEVSKPARWADESISLTTERMLMHYSYLLRSETRAKELGRKMYSVTAAERKYRTGQGYISANIDRDEISAERSIERESLLKKWSQSVLYLTNQNSKIDKGLVHVFAGAAAAIAMGVAVILAFIADAWFSVYTVPWVLIIIISYILKDRIKEIIRGLLVRILPRLISDKTEKLVDQRKNELVGKSRSFVKFLNERSLPEDIREAMIKGRDKLKKSQPEGDVIWYKRTLVLKSGKLLKDHSRVNSVTEIMRVSLDPFTEMMDNPQKSICRIHGGQLHRITGNRVYHCDIFIKLIDNLEKQERVFWYDVVLSKKGLHRIQKMNFTNNKEKS